MKKVVFIQLMMCVSLVAMAQKECKVLSREDGLIRFEVDENLPKPEEDMYFYDSAEQQARSLVSSSVPLGYKPEILAYSFAGEKMALFREDEFFAALVEAYADHRPFVLSPDMVWQVISFNFSEYVNNHAEEMRSLLVPHEGVKDLIIMTDEDILNDKNANWSDLFDKFSAAIAENTKGDIAQLMTSDFSTTGMTERIASQITLMESLKSYFHYIAGRLACGIPNITLKGTPADWRKVAEKVQGLERYNMGWWTKELKPIMAEFVKTAEGHPDKKFWKDIVMRDLPDRLRGGGCSLEKPTDLDGWMVKLFPDMKKGQMQTTIPYGRMQGAELSNVQFKYQLIDPVTLKVIEETDIMLYAGFVGVAVDKATGALEPKIGWIARKVDEEGEQLARLTSTAVSANASTPKIKTVPEVLKREKYYKHLHLTFEDKVVVPEWMDDIQIDDFTIEGYMSEAEQAQLKNRFPKAKVNRLLHNITTRRNLAPGQYAYRLDSIVSVASYGTTAAFYLTYDEQGRIAEMLQTTPSNRILKPVKHIYSYDERGFCVGENHYDVVDGKDVLLTEDLITYTDDGRLLKKESKMYDKNGKLYRFNTDSYTYDQRGNLVEQMGEYKMVNSGTVSKRKTTCAYNARNQQIEEVLYGYKTQEDEFFPNITMKMEYDKKGRVNHQTDITSSGLGEDGKYETFIEYTELNGQVVREQRKRNSSRDDKWTVEVQSRSYDIYGNLVREDHEKNNTYSGSTNYYYDLATKTENVQGLDWYGKPGMTPLQLYLLVQACEHKYRLMRINGVNASGDFEGLSGANTSSDDVRFYYTSLP